MTEAVRIAIQKTGAAIETATETETVRKVFSKKAEAFRKAAKEMFKTKRYPKQVKKKPERAPSYQEEQKTELKKLKLAAGIPRTLTKGPVIDSVLSNASSNDRTRQ